MVIVARGQFEYHKESWYEEYLPPIWVEIDQSFAISKYEVTRGEFERFVDETSYRTEAESDPKHGCYADNSRDDRKNGYRWNRHEYRQEDDHPVVCVSIRDALAYAAWLSRDTGYTYRLPSPAEWEYARRAGDRTLMPVAPVITASHFDWLDELCAAGKRRCGDDSRWDRTSLTTAVGQFTPNGIGLHDMFGNVGELVMHCVRENSLIMSGSGNVRSHGEAEDPNTCLRSDLIVALDDAWRNRPVYNLPHTDQSEDWRGRTRTNYRRSSSFVTGFRVVRELEEEIAR